MVPQYKICPRCQQPAVLDMAVCRRCGTPYPGPAVERRPGQPPPPVKKRKDSTGLIVLVGLFCLAVLLVGGAVALRRAGRLRQDFMSSTGTPSAPPGKPSGNPDLMGSMFIERPSQKEMPTVYVMNMAIGTMHLELRAGGKVYEVYCEVGEKKPLQVPAGNYLVHVSCNQPGVIPTDGDATFRKFKEYDAPFSLGEPGSPMHLGD